MKTDEIVWDVKKDRVLRELKKGKRINDREKIEGRNIEINPDIITRAEGSSMVTMGNTRVVAGVKLGTGDPYSNQPNQGTLMTNIELSPVASPSFETGPPGQETVEIARVVDRGIRESEMIDLEELCIEPRKKVWMVFIDLYPLDQDGNLIDASAIAAVNALRNAKLPKYEDGKIVREESQGDLPIVDTPVAKTFSKIGDDIVLDPDLEEEKAQDARMTVYVNDKDNICASQKGGTGSFKRKEINNIIEKAVEVAPETRRHLKNKE